ncbi:MAG: metallophosphoesterase [Deltaproteobacteria bacterium]|jgi:hypothetical protein|nr:metallophosphoesterase [Deltaproteobacteria bacterium]
MKDNYEGKNKHSLFNGQTTFSLSRRTFLTGAGSAVVLSACEDSSSTLNNNNDAGVDIDGDLDVVNDIEDVQDVTDITDGDLDADADADGGEEIPRPPTTVSEMVVGVLEEVEQLEDLRHQYGKTQKVAGEPYLERDDINASAKSDGSVYNLNSLAYFAQLTDVHIVDEESPARAIHSPFSAASAWRPQEPYSPHLLDAAMKTINSFIPARAHDFVAFTGDITDNHLFTELNTFLNVVEGNLVDPDSGLDDDPLPPGEPDPHDPFQAQGLDSQIDWYSCLGNHDYWALGSVSDSMIANPTSDSATIYLSDYVIPTCFEEPPCIDTWCYSDLPDRCNMPVNDDFYTESYTPPDPNREYVSLNDWMGYFVDSDVQMPAGHGYEQENIDSSFSYWYKENVVPNYPVSLVSLDTTTNNSGVNKADGSIDSAQLSWLDERLTYLEGNNQIIIIMSHHPSDEAGSNSEQLQAVLNSHPNVVLHIVGHGHKNKVYPRPAPEGEDISCGYWELQSPSLLDWPQQMRFLEIVDLGDGTGAVYTTMVDLDIQPGELAEAGRFYGLLYVQEGASYPNGRGAEMDRNTALRFAWPDSLLSVLGNLPQRDVESLHFLP